MEYKKVKVNIELTLPVESVVPNLPVTLLPAASSIFLGLYRAKRCVSGGCWRKAVINSRSSAEVG